MDFPEENPEEKKLCLGKIIDTAGKVIPAIALFVPALQPVAAINHRSPKRTCAHIQHAVVRGCQERESPVNISDSLLWSNHMRIKLLVWAQISAIVFTASLMTW
jgi:hypothetical protein